MAQKTIRQEEFFDDGVEHLILHTAIGRGRRYEAVPPNVSGLFHHLDRAVET